MSTNNGKERGLTEKEKELLRAAFSSVTTSDLHEQLKDSEYFKNDNFDVFKRNIFSFIVACRKRGLPVRYFEGGRGRKKETISQDSVNDFLSQIGVDDKEVKATLKKTADRMKKREENKT